MLPLNISNVKQEMKTEDLLTRKFTAFASFQEMIDAAGDFAPTLYYDNTFDGIRRGLLANEYNRAQALRGDARRCKLLRI